MAKPRIEVITEGLLTRMLQQDPELAGVGLALTVQARELLRDQTPLKLPIMSATPEGQNAPAILDDPPQIISSGRSYPVDLIYCGTQKQGESINQQ